MQDYKLLKASDLLSASRSTINNDLESVKSNFSGTYFPTQDLVEGMFCWRTDLKKMYQLEADLTTWKLLYDLSSNDGILVKNSTNAVYATKDAEGNNIADTYYRQDLLAHLKDDLYPVGSVLITMTATNPSTYLGGEWQQIAGGRTLIGASSGYTAGSTGGSETESYTPTGTIGDTALTVNQIPAHSHSAWTDTQGNHAHSYETPQRPCGDNDEGKYGSNTWNIEASYTYTTSYAGSHSHNVGIGNTGGSQGHNHSITCDAKTISHMQPYLVTYIWQKVKKAFN